MFYLIQDNLFCENGYKRLVIALERLGLDHEFITVRPFIEDLEFKTDRKDVFVFGAIKLARLAKKHNWIPGSLMTENHNFEVYREKYGDHLLNADSIVCRMDTDIEFDGPKFIRPTLDTKEFDGKVFFTKEEWVESRDRHWHNEFASESTVIQVSSPKKIHREFRFYIVDGKVVTGSQYKMGGRIVITDMIDEEAARFCQKMVDTYQLAKAFVMDVALIEGGPKIVECGCINCAGFYEADLQKLLIALEKCNWN